MYVFQAIWFVGCLRIIIIIIMIIIIIIIIIIEHSSLRKEFIMCDPKRTKWAA